MTDSQMHPDCDVVVVGSGFGGSVAALRFAEAGEKVCVLERGDWLTREGFEADFDLLWNPRRNAFGVNDFRSRGKRIVTWTGSGVGGGSLVYAGALIRLEVFDGYPDAIRHDLMDRYYDAAERMLGAALYPDYPPYGDVPLVRLMLRTAARLATHHPEVVEGHGRLNMALSFAPPDGRPGEQFVNVHGASQRYVDPYEQGMLGGDIDSKNSLDRNYLYLAMKAEPPVEVRTLHEVDRIESLDGVGYRVYFRRYEREQGWVRRLRRRWIPRGMRPNYSTGSVTTRRLVISAGAMGSAELLLRNRDVYNTMPGLSSLLGTNYSTNGDYLMLMIPWRRALISWAAAFTAALLVVMGYFLWAIPAVALYYGVVWFAGRPFAPDVGSNNSTFIRFAGSDGKPQGAYIEGGNYPLPGKILGAIFLSTIGAYRPSLQRILWRVGRWLQLTVPPFGAIAFSWPVALLTMGRDEAQGRITLNKDLRAEIQFEVKANRQFYSYVEVLGRKVAKEAAALWLSHPFLRIMRRLEVPHNQGGVPMGGDSTTGVVDHAGRVFGQKNLMVLDGSILPRSPGPNPALTITAIAERAMEHIRRQIAHGGDVIADPGSTARDIDMPSSAN